METSFTRTLRCLRAEESGRPFLVSAFAVGALALWGAWFAWAPVSVSAVSSSARLEAGASAHRVAALSAGRIVAVRAALGDAVSAGDVLFELDAQAHRLELDETKARLPGLEAQREALLAEIAAEEQRLASLEGAGRAEIEETGAWILQAETAACTARDDAQRVDRLQAEGLVADAEALRLRSLAQVKDSETKALTHRQRRLDLEHRERIDEALARKQHLSGGLARLEGEIAATGAALKRLELAVAERFVRAPIDGSIGALSTHRLGAVVQEGEELAVVVPDGELSVVAEFPVAEAAGRVAPRQRARMRLDGFPWSHCGSLPATVATVAAEPEQAVLRVELRATDAEAFPVALRHGMTGDVEVEVESVSPAVLVLRAVGRLVGRADRESER